MTKQLISANLFCRGEFFLTEELRSGSFWRQSTDFHIKVTKLCQRVLVLASPFDMGH